MLPIKDSLEIMPQSATRDQHLQLSIDDRS